MLTPCVISVCCSVGTDRPHVCPWREKWLWRSADARIFGRVKIDSTPAGTIRPLLRVWPCSNYDEISQVPADLYCVYAPLQLLAWLARWMRPSLSAFYMKWQWATNCNCTVHLCVIVCWSLSYVAPPRHDQSNKCVPIFARSACALPTCRIYLICSVWNIKWAKTNTCTFWPDKNSAHRYSFSQGSCSSVSGVQRRQHLWFFILSLCNFESVKIRTSTLEKSYPL